MSLDKFLRKIKIDEAIIEKIVKVEYLKSENIKQNTANFMSEALKKAETLIDYDTLSQVMAQRSCCKSGYRLKNAKEFALLNKDKTLEEKVQLLGSLKYMGKPFLNDNKEIETIAVGGYEYSKMKCPCDQIAGNNPTNDIMPLTYCKCCAGHFQFHYQKALNIKLKLKTIKSSILNSQGTKPCVFVYEKL